MWEIIDYKQEYCKEMIEMTVEYYGLQNDISNHDFIEHEYFSNPDGDAFIKLAFDREKNRLAGQYIVIPRNYSVNGSSVSCVLSLNTLTRAEYRGQQIFTKLAEAVYKECWNQKKFFCYGAPNPNSYHGFVKKLDFSKIGEIPLYLKITNPYRLICDKMHISYRDNKLAGEGSEDIIRKDNSELSIIKISNENIQLFDLFWEKIKFKYSVIGVRNAEYMKWRYLELPLRDYWIYMAVQNYLPCGYVIGRISEVAGMRCGMIVDFLVNAGRDDAGKLLLNKMMREFRKRRIGLSGCLMQKESEEAGYLCNKGFFICPHKLLPQPFPIILRQFHSLVKKDREALEDFSQWFFTMGDYDVI